MPPEPRPASAASDLTRVLAAEALGAGALAFCVIAAGVLGERFSGDYAGLATLITALAGASAFVVLAFAFAPVALCYFNPGLAFVALLTGRMKPMSALSIAAVQIAAAGLGAMLAHVVTNTGLVQVATQIETGSGVWAGEFAGAAAFVIAITAGERKAPRFAAFIGAFALLAVALVTPSLSFANPALTFARTLTDSFTSIRLADAAPLCLCQFLGAAAAAMFGEWLWRDTGGRCQ